MAYTRVWSETRPLGTQRVKELDDEIRFLRVDISERLVTLLGITMSADPLLVVKLGGAVTFNGAGYQANQPMVDLGNITGTVALDFDVRGNFIKCVLTGATTFTVSNMRVGTTYVLYIVQDATGGRTVTWPAGIRPPGGSAPTLNTTANRASLLTITPYTTTVATLVLAGTNINVS